MDKIVSVGSWNLKLKDENNFQIGKLRCEIIKDALIISGSETLIKVGNTKLSFQPKLENSSEFFASDPESVCFSGCVREVSVLLIIANIYEAL